MATLEVEFDTGGPAMRVVLRGDVDLVNRDRLREALDLALTTAAQLIEVDLSGVTFLDASGVGALLGAYDAAHARGLILRADGAAGAVRRVLEITGAAGVLGATVAESAGD